MKLVNLTPHAITVISDDDEKFEITPSGTVARVATHKTQVAEIDGIPVYRQTFGEVEGLPAPEQGVCYVVSALVLSALNGARPDVLAPDTGAAVRDEAGRILGVRGFVQ